MYSTDRDALMCDMAETYRIYDMNSVPFSVYATLAAGLRSNSRIRMEMSGMKDMPDVIPLTRIHDMLAKRWSKKGHKPFLLRDALFSNAEKDNPNKRIKSIRRII